MPFAAPAAARDILMIKYPPLMRMWFRCCAFTFSSAVIAVELEIYIVGYYHKNVSAEGMILNHAGTRTRIAKINQGSGYIN